MASAFPPSPDDSSTQEDSDGALWRAVQRQEPAALARLEQRIARVCTGALRRFGATREDLESLLQDVLVSVWTHAREQPDDADAVPHLDAFLWWRARGALRSLRRRFPARGEPLELFSAASESDRPVDALGVQELLDGLHDCSSTMDLKYRRVWEARYTEGLDPRETAERLGTDRGRVAVLLQRARRLLESCLQRKGLL